MLKHFSSGPLYESLNVFKKEVKGINAITSNGVKFQVLNQGFGSIIKTQLKKGDALVTKPGSILYSSGKIDTQLESSNIRQSTMQKISGSSYFLERFVCNEDDSVIILAPDELGDSACIELDGTRDLIIKSKYFVYASGDLDISVSPNGFGLTNGSFAHSAITGTGSLGISAFGGIVSVNLAPGEECIIEPK
jgi:uncharacterized protein (AIM24 family)